MVTGSRRIAAGLLCGALLLGAGMAAVAPGPAQAQASSPVRMIADRLHVRNHRGGYLPRVVAGVEAARRAGVEVRIDGGFCFSACTAWLALERVCVAPWTQFGFHAPSDPRSGRKLSGAAFENATTHVAGYYRPPLARWWMREGRHVSRGMALLSGADLIAMGYRACPTGS